MIRREAGFLIIRCDDENCAELLRTGTRDFKATWKPMRNAGWYTAKSGEKWLHYCGTCSAKHVGNTDVDIAFRPRRRNRWARQIQRAIWIACVVAGFVLGFLIGNLVSSGGSRHSAVVGANLNGPKLR